MENNKIFTDTEIIEIVGIEEWLESWEKEIDKILEKN